MEPTRIAAALNTLADRMDSLTVPDRLSTRDAIISVVIGEGDEFCDEFARLWEQGGPNAANVWAEGVNHLFSAVFATLFPGDEPFRFMTGAELRTIADRQPTAA